MTRFEPIHPLLLAAIVGCQPDTEGSQDPDPERFHGWATPFVELPPGQGGTVLVTQETHLSVFGMDTQVGGASWLLTATSLCRDEFDSGVDARSAAQFNDKWAVGGAAGRLLISDDSGINRFDVPTADDLVGVWLGGAETWAVTAFAEQATGDLWRRQTNAAWELMAIDLSGPFHGAWGRWFFGDEVAIYWDGVTLGDVPTPEGAQLYAAHGHQVPTLWFAGGQDRAQLFRWDTTGWLEVEVPERCGHGGLRAVWEDPEGVVWVGGESGTAARWNGADWTCNEQPDPSTTYTAVMGLDQQVLWIGGRVEGAGDASGIFSSYPSREFLPEVLPCSP